MDGVGWVFGISLSLAFLRRMTLGAGITGVETELRTPLLHDSQATHELKIN